MDYLRRFPRSDGGYDLVKDAYPEIVGYFERTHPEALRYYMPKYRIDEPAGYWPVKTFATSVLVACSVAKHADPDDLCAQVFCLAGIYANKLRTPTYFVTRDLVAAALRTELPADLQLDEIRFPLDAMLFMLPRGSFRHEKEGDAAFVFVAKAPASLAGLPESEPPCLIVTTTMPEAYPLQSYHTNIPLEPGRTSGQTFAELDSGPFYFGADPVEDTTDSVTLSTKEFVSALGRLGLTLILLLGAHPEFVEYGTLSKRIKSKHPGQPTRWCGPNIVGGTYTAQRRRETAVEGASTKRPHWVRGHIRHQSYGSEHSLRKLIWIQPYRTGL